MEADTSSNRQDSAGVQPEEDINLDELEWDDPQFYMKMSKVNDQVLETLRKIALEEVTWDRLNTNLDLASALSPEFITHMSWLESVLRGGSHQGIFSAAPAAESFTPNDRSTSS